MSIHTWHPVSSKLLWGRYDWNGNHNLPWATDLNTVNATVDWSKLDVIRSAHAACPNLLLPGIKFFSQTAGFDSVM